MNGGWMLAGEASGMFSWLKITEKVRTRIIPSSHWTVFQRWVLKSQVRAPCWRRVMSCQYSSSSIHKSIGSQPKAQKRVLFPLQADGPCWCYKSIHSSISSTNWSSGKMPSNEDTSPKNYMSQTLRIQTVRQFQWKDPEQSKKSWKRSAAPMRFVVKTSIKEFPTKHKKQAETTLHQYSVALSIDLQPANCRVLCLFVCSKLKQSISSWRGHG